jgi:NAD(P)-dependent dehydrogenase (short-subunit alcohol dehydrogenase family)
MSDLSHRAKAPRILVMGASSGIGQELIRQLSARGAHVVACARRVERIGDLDNVVARGCDLRDAEQGSLVASYSQENLVRAMPQR